MAGYLKGLGILLCVLGVLGTVYCGWGVWTDEAYYKAALAMEKYPNNVLYTTELKMAEPRHMLLLAGTFASAPIGIILGSICIGISTILARLGDGSGRR
ncbi:MAG TPA: hypothetical protein VEC57_11350 [Candidatus Limnocylindrales bacterium]|nr:hypothetical protein [Candidatus Limnocylindrales bacterium]